MNMSAIELYQVMDSIAREAYGGSTSPSGESDSSEHMGTVDAIRELSDGDIADITLRDPNSGVLVNIGPDDANVSNIALRNETRDIDQSINAGEIRSNGSCIKMGSDGVVTIQSNGKDVLKISSDEIVITNDLRISINSIKNFADCINDNFAQASLWI